ncbi:YqgQ family protein [Macrococcoides bohemicum]|uniref:YqgQ family protein n=1 Tax=Macrococcoides bohemicum TaxID=1903056 RepID=UPI003B00328F
MHSFYDVQQLLKQFGIIIYFKDEKDNIEMMNQEIKSLHDAGIITNEQFVQARLILNQRKMGKI